MRIISVPIRLRLATAFSLLTIPLAAFETILATQAPWWRLPYQTLEIWVSAVALIAIPLATWTLRGKRTALYVWGLFGAIWVLLSALFAFRFKNTDLGFFAVFLAFYWLVGWFWIRLEIGRSFLDPQIRWYESLPKTIPELRCEMASDQPDVKLGFRVRRFDRDGTFLIADAEGQRTIRFPALTPIQEMTFHYRGRQVHAQGRAVSYIQSKIGGNAGIGLQFQEMSPDSEKKLGDFLEILRGEGHVG